MAAATATTKVPAVYGSIAAVLKGLAVEKNGTLPGNMGGKPYITAVDVAQEVKSRFVENGLVFVPHEEVVKHETLTDPNGRRTFVIVVTGTYDIISTKDGSSVTISGTGDGVATGTAVSSNIASTNAFKNALLRTFLITEQSVEEYAKNGTVDAAGPAAPSPVQQRVTKAKATAAKKAPSKANTDTRAFRDIIREDYIENEDSPYDAAAVNALVEDTVKATGKPKGEVYGDVLKRLEAGETV